MRKLLNILLLLLMPVVVFPLHAQLRTQQMEARLSAADTDPTERLALYDSLSWDCIDYDFAKAVRLAEEGIALARATGDEAMEGKLIMNLGAAYMRQPNHELSLEYLDSAALIAVRIGDRQLEGRVYNSMANVYGSQKKSSTAMEYYQRSLDIAEEVGDLHRVASLYNNMGALLANQSQWERAQPYYIRALVSARTIGDSSLMASAHFNLGLNYRARNMKDSAYYHLRTADDITTIAGGKYLKTSILMGLAAYYEWNDEPQKGLEANTEALALAREIGYDRLVNDCLKNITFNHLALGHYAKANEMAIGLMPLIDSADYKQFYDLHYVSTVANMKMGRGNEASAHLDSMLANIYRNNNAESWSAMAEMEARYETEKKEMRIAALAEENRLYLTLVLVGVATVLMLVAALIFYNRYQRLKRLRSREEIEHLRSESKLVAARSLLDGESRERGRLSRELHDGLGGLLTMVKLNLIQAQGSVAQKNEKLDHAVILMDNTINEMRRMAHNLMPEALARFGLKPVIEEYCKGSETVAFHFFGEPRRLGDKVEVHFYRIACELINNALKHSGATEINVQLIIMDDKLSLTVEDNGKGLSKQDVNDGMPTVRSRVELLGAKMDVYTKPSRGSEINIELDL